VCDLLPFVLRRVGSGTSFSIHERGVELGKGGSDGFCLKWGEGREEGTGRGFLYNGGWTVFTKTMDFRLASTGAVRLRFEVQTISRGSSANLPVHCSTGKGVAF